MVFPTERTHFFQVSIKLAHPFPAPELRTRILRTRGFYSEKGGRPQRGGTNLGVFVPMWPGHKHAGVVTGHVGMNTPKFVPPCWGRPPFHPTQTLSGPVLRDTARLSQRYPPIARYGVFGVSTWPVGCDTPLPVF